MRLDYDLLATILKHVEEVTDGQERHTITRNTFSPSLIECESFEVLAYHFDVLCLNGFIDGNVLRTPYQGHRVASNVDYFNLTLQGHQLLDSIQNQAIWNRIKAKAQELGVEGLKQIPALAISLITGNPS